VSSGDFEVIVHNRHRDHDFVKKFLTATPGFALRQLDPHLKLGHSDGGNCYVVFVANQFVEIGVRPICIN